MDAFDYFVTLLSTLRSIYLDGVAESLKDDLLNAADRVTLAWLDRYGPPKEETSFKERLYDEKTNAPDIDDCVAGSTSHGWPVFREG